MDAGKLNCLVQLLQENAGQDSIGQPVTAWTSVGDAWANIRHVSGAEFIRGGAQTAVATVSIRLRFRTDMTTAMRVQHGATLYEITAVLPDLQKRDHVDLTCKEIT